MGEKKVILFGAGQIGKKALSYFGKEKVYCFVDNAPKLAGSRIEGVPVISFEQLKEIYQGYRLMISMDVVKSLVVAVQLEEAGIAEYELFLKILERDKKTQPLVSASRINGRTHTKAEKNVLMITYHFPPLSGSGVFRSLKFAKYLPQFGWDPIVLGADRARADWRYVDQSLLDEIPDSVDVIRIADPVGSLQDTSLMEKKGSLLPFLHEILECDPEAEALFSSFLQSRTGTMEMLVFPCTALLWAYQVVQYIEQNLDIRNIQAVYTSSDPYSAPLVGHYLKRKYGLPWLADYRDPWTGDPALGSDLDRPRNDLLYHLESILLEQADCNMTVSQEAVEDYVKRFGIAREKMISITNGYDEADYVDLKIPTKRLSHFTINYSGLLHVGRSIDAVLEALQQLGDEGSIDLDCVRFRIVGDSRQYEPKAVARKFGLGSIMIETGYISHKEALQTNLESSLLLLLVGGDDEQYKQIYTGKFFDYLRSGRPILALGPKDGAVDRTLRETGHGETFRSTQIPEIKAMILREYQRWQSGQVVPLLHSPKIEQFERKYLTGQLAEKLGSVRR